MMDRYMERMMDDVAPAVGGAHALVPFGTLGAWMTRAAILIVVAVLGIIVAGVVARTVQRALRRTKIDRALRALGWRDVLEKGGITAAPSSAIAWLVKWFIIIVVFAGIVNALGAAELAVFFRQILAYIPRVIIAIVILVIGALAARAVSAAILAATTAARVAVRADLLARLARIAIIVVAVLAALKQLGIAASLVDTFFRGIVYGAALAFGLAFGLGGRGAAERLLAQLTAPTAERASEAKRNEDA